MTEAIVDIGSGSLQGRVVDGVASFKGIPYAAPPLGDLRWRPPRPVEPWSGVRPATEFGSDCMQVKGQYENIQTTPSEDCLYLNVWKPADAVAGDGLPVLVWIHGGGYVGGGTSTPAFDGTAFAGRGIVVVTLNYRLSRFGFFTHPALLAEDDGPVGNYGYLDQIHALEWVQENIATFGGDPDAVTLIGESAGGASVLHLLTSPVVPDGLFHQVMVMSGGGRDAIITRPMTHGSRLNLSATMVDRMFARSNGVKGDGPEALAALQALPADLVKGGEDLERLAQVKLMGGPIYGVPIIDGTVVVGEPGDLIAAGNAKRLPVIIGSTAVDIPCHFPPNRLRPLEWFGDLAAAARIAYRVPDGRFQKPAQLVHLMMAMGVDMSMHEPAHFVAHSMREADQPAWVYRFTYTAESTRPQHLEQMHAGEVPFLFGTLGAAYGDAVTENDQAVADAFNAYAANFVISGDPNGAGLPEWPQAVPDAYDLMHFTLDDGPVHEPDPRPGVELVAHARRSGT